MRVLALEDCDSRDPNLGGKAAGLVRLREGGLDVPKGFVISAGFYREALAAIGRNPEKLDDLQRRLATAPLAPELIVQIESQLARLVPPLIVRSSATCEDQPDKPAPGIFLSIAGVEPNGLHDAIRAVWASLLSETARFYFGEAALKGAAMAVLVQELQQGLHGTLYTRDPSDPQAATLLIETERAGCDPAFSLVRRDDLAFTPAWFPIAPEPIARAGLVAETLFGVPVDVEWVATGSRVWVVQARPIVFRNAPGEKFPDDALAFSRGEPSATWTWDAAHNPDPLSPMQEGLVAWVLGLAPIRQRTVCGYLYCSREGAPPARRSIAAADLPRVFAEELLPAIEKHLIELESAGSWGEALDRYRDVYALYAGELAPSLSRASKLLPDFLAKQFPAAQAERFTARLYAGATLGFEGPLLISWDVADPPIEAAPDRRRVAIDSQTVETQVLAQLGRMERRAFKALYPIARQVATLAEHDDVYFARAQLGIRRALARLAADWHADENDLAFLAPDDLRNSGPPRDLVERAANARRLREQRRRLRPPFQIVDGQALYRPTSGSLSGRGVGGRAHGPVTHAASFVPGAVLVASTLLPTMAPLVSRSLAVITEHGGLLGHGAALARDLGIPCVVGCAGAGALLDGEIVWVDGDAGVVLRDQR